VSDHAHRPASRTSLNLVLGALLLVGAAGCLTARRPDSVRPQDWWHERGPVIPHDTFPTDCSLCHTSENWTVIRDDFVFDHAAETGVPLLGAHLAAECLRCHNDRGPVQAFSVRGCAGCHEDAHQGTLGSECRTCHTEADWQPFGQVAEHARTRFPLIGAHTALLCIECHAGAPEGNFSRQDIACVSCHQQDLAQATTPDHQAQGWIERCDRCHIPTTWAGAGFSHAFFKLSGGHGGLQCTDCHVGGSFTGTPGSCVGCHLTAYQATTAPDHQAAGFSTQCAQCHTIKGWQGAVFDHSSFPLTGEHAGAACADCHPGGLYKGTPSSCFACHQVDYETTANPDHAAAGYGKQCQTCHTTASWRNVSLEHSTFPLTGKHLKAACLDCHVDGIFAGTPSTCVSCHQSDYDGTTSPDHTAAGFPTTCQSCHGTGKWMGATFSHPFFPIKQGKHKGFACTDCHVVPTDFSVSSCVDCHTHNMAETDALHDGVDGYAFNSAACYMCHPKGKAGN
jgi:Cytochrome c3